MRLSGILATTAIAFLAGACSSASSDPGAGSYGGNGAGGNVGGSGCSAPDCSACGNCFALCVCKTGKSQSCASACGSSGGGSSSGGSSSGGSSSGGSTSTDPYANARQKCVERINAFRATLNLPPYSRWTGTVEPCTDSQAKSDSQTGTAHGAFGKCNESAQNECPGWPSVASITDGTGSCLQMMWNEGPGADFQAHGHYINMSSKKYSKVACGFYKTPKGEIWAVQDFR